MGKVLVSVICTNYNKGEWIRDAVESFLRQKTDFEFEILLIDDKSTDSSPEIIREYAEQYPDKIRTYFNEKNLGITKTWIKICKEAKGKYIARCDGDDYWIDELKLQKQVDLLETNKDSQWSCSDYSMVSLDGDVTQESVVKNGIIHCPRNYAEMFATKGMTMASTWMMSAKLMQRINATLNESAVDDTFNIQLDLFHETKLTFIDEPQVAYRMNDGSDSRPTDKKRARARDERLLGTQLEYLKKYKNVDYEDIIKVLLRRDMENDEINREAHDRLRIISDQREHIEALEKLVIEKDDVISQRDRQIADILGSKKYKIGRAVVSPAVAAKAVLNKGKKR